MKYLIGFSLMVLAFAGCTSRHELVAEQNKVTRPNVISVSADWISDKGKKYDLGFNVHNEHNKGIIILLKEFRCFKGKTEGVVKHAFFNAGERTIDFRQGQMKQFKLVCTAKGEPGGEFKIIISKVYENPNDDGKTTGKVLAQNIEWKAAFAKDKEEEE